MSLEATVIIVDNSEWSRNGDFQPSRFMAQVDAITLISRSKVQANVENVVGLVDLTGPTCHMTLVQNRDIGKLMSSLHRIKIKGMAKFSGSIQVAQLALKHRQNKRQDQRVICFVASPVSESESTLKRLGTRLKKNNVAVDVISFGENDINSSKLKEFVDAVNKDGNSRFFEISEGSNLTKTLQNSSFFGEADIMAARDEYEDDVMEMVMRISLQDAQNNFNTYRDENAANDAEDHAFVTDAELNMQPNNLLGMDNQMDIDYDPELSEALMLSLQESQQASWAANDNTYDSKLASKPNNPTELPPPSSQECMDIELENEGLDPEMIQALMLSLKSQENSNKASEGNNDGAGPGLDQVSITSAESKRNVNDVKTKRTLEEGIGDEKQQDENEKNKKKKEQ